MNVVNLVEMKANRVARGPSPGALLAVTDVLSRAACRKPANASNDFMEFMKSQVVMECEMHHIKHEEKHLDKEHHASRKCVKEWTAIVDVLLGGVALICGLEAPSPKRQKNKCDDYSNEECAGIARIE